MKTLRVAEIGGALSGSSGTRVGASLLPEFAKRDIGGEAIFTNQAGSIHNRAIGITAQHLGDVRYRGS